MTEECSHEDEEFFLLGSVGVAAINYVLKLQTFSWSASFGCFVNEILDEIIE